MASFFKQVGKAIKAAQKQTDKKKQARKPTKPGRAKPQVVRIAYRELNRPAPDWDPTDLERGYAYLWTLPTPPAIGQRVIVEHARGQTAIVVGFGTTYKGDLLSVHRIVTPAEIADASAKADADEDAWIQMARRAAGLGSTTRRTRVPSGFPSIPPTDGQASARAAGEHGGIWWRVYKTAQAEKWPQEEIRRVESIARRWYAVRDKGGN